MLAEGCKAAPAWYVRRDWEDGRLAPNEHVPLEVSSVTKVYPGGVQALDQVSFRISPGERACLLGPNGAGKTTLIRLLTGALRPSSGQVSLFGLGVEDPGFLQAKRRVGIVPQSPGMYRDLTVDDFLQLVRDLYGRGNIPEVVEAFGLGPFRSRRMAELSGGMQRRLSMAAALVSSPEVLLLDEPTVGLDPVATREVHTFLRKVMPGRTVLLCTHNLAEAEALCESAVILRQGKVLLHERIATLRQRIQPVLVLRATQGPERLAEALAGQGLTLTREEDAVHVHVADAAAQAPGMLRHLLGAGVDVYECRVVTPSLEDLFLDVVGASDARA
ncbi:ABC-2 type transport system ATP-binding protein [Archangium gephyra]|uniref:ABC transporter, ATP-binding protein n=1 Tax=Archangium gephyra TaxID=48 RepID=A0AAC8QHW3_9BACT|nr:ABC transporter ATP-binding protein [Archangium gephyra]AKJ07778.1 ABC transporter, ATP-binding protein [Archangium gephyra]REG29531.1 ABC-2 type transport system ATP-binding protein [Archangium gephyra]